MNYKTISRKILLRLTFLLFLIFPVTIDALDTINHTLLDHAKSFPRTTHNDLEILVPKLISIATNDQEKAEVLFYWISQNIVYDVDGFLSGKYIETITGTIEQGKGVCGNYADLYEAMCQLAGLECYVISGYAKGYGYEPGMIFKKADHAWNAVRIDSTYLFVDATWGSGSVGIVDRKMIFYPKLELENVLVPAGDFSATRLPANPIWQLLEKPISLRNFQAHDNFHDMQAIAGVQINYRDSLQQFLTLEPEWRKVIAAYKVYQFNPTEKLAWRLGDAYYFYGYDLSVGEYNERTLRKALLCFEASIACFRTVKGRYEAAQREIRSLNKNIAYVRYRLKAGV